MEGVLSHLAWIGPLVVVAAAGLLHVARRFIVASKARRAEKEIVAPGAAQGPQTASHGGDDPDDFVSPTAAVSPPAPFPPRVPSKVEQAMQKVVDAVDAGRPKGKNECTRVEITTDGTEVAWPMNPGEHGPDYDDVADVVIIDHRPLPPEPAGKTPDGEMPHAGYALRQHGPGATGSYPGEHGVVVHPMSLPQTDQLVKTHQRAMADLEARAAKEYQAYLVDVEAVARGLAARMMELQPRKDLIAADAKARNVSVEQAATSFVKTVVAVALAQAEKAYQQPDYTAVNYYTR